MKWWILASAVVPVLAFSIACIGPACGCGGDPSTVIDGTLDAPAAPDDTGEVGDTGDTGIGETGDTGQPEAAVGPGARHLRVELADEDDEVDRDR